MEKLFTFIILSFSAVFFNDKPLKVKRMVINKVFVISLPLLYLSFHWNATGFEVKNMFGLQYSCSSIVISLARLVMPGPGFLPSINVLCPSRFFVFVKYLC